MTENQEESREQMNKDQVIKLGNQILENSIQENVTEFSSFTANEASNLTAGDSVLRKSIFKKEMSQEAKTHIMRKVRTGLNNMGFLLEEITLNENDDPFNAFKVSLKNGGETEVAK